MVVDKKVYRVSCMFVWVVVLEVWLERGRGMGKGEVGGERGERK